MQLSYCTCVFLVKNLFTCYHNFYTARLQTGRIMVWWCPSVRPSFRVSVRPSVRPSQFSALFSYMLWHIDLKFCVSLYFYARKIKFECHQFPSLFAGVMLLFNFKLLQICSFPHFSPTCFDIFSSNFCIWLWFNVPQSKFECRYFASIFVGVMPLCELRILEIHSFPHFSLTCFDILSWNFAYDFVFTVLQIKFECRQFASIFGVMPLLELRILEIHSFPHFSLTLFNILSWTFAYYFVFLYYRSSLNIVNLRVYFGVMPLFELRIL